MNEWERGVKKVHHPEYDYIREEINRLFKETKQNIAKESANKGKKSEKKNLELIRIYLPKKDFKFLEKFHPFKKFHNLGGIPCHMINEERIRIDTEVVNPRKRKRKTVIYVEDMKK